jgi:uncharacterized Fe-S center protein
MTSEVYFAQRRATSGGGLLDKIEQLFETAGFAQAIAEGDLVALKTCFGERGNTTHVRPEILKRLIRKARQRRAIPFVTDTGALGLGPRSNATTHLMIATEHGFTEATLGAPVMIADGLMGHDHVPVRIAARHLDTVPVASALWGAQALIVVNHVTAEPDLGLAGALHHLGLRSVTRAGRPFLTHAATAERCAACGSCLLTVGAPPETIPILPEPPAQACLACCDDEARLGAPLAPAERQERLAEACLAALQGKEQKACFFNIMLDVTPEGDDAPFSDAPVIADVGVLASRDPVALDQATLDFFATQPGLPGTRLGTPAAPDKLAQLAPGANPEHLLAYAEALGIGRRDYELLII